MHPFSKTLLTLAGMLLSLPLAAASPAASNTPPDAPSAAVTNSGWTQRLTMEHSESLSDFTMHWSDTGSVVRLSDASGVTNLVCTLKRRKTTWRGAPSAVFDTTFDEGTRVTAMHRNTNAVATVALRRSRQPCVIYVAGQPALAMPDVWAGLPLTIEIPAANLPGDAEEGFEQRLGTFTFHDDSLTDKESPQALKFWETIAGDWGLHAVTGTVTGNVHRELKRFPKPERSPNFYSLNGHGTNATILAGEPFYNHYTYQASVQHNAGTNGLLFLVTDEGVGQAFTVHTDPASGYLTFALWNRTPVGKGLGDLVEAVATDCVPGQWLLMEVRLHEDRVVCLVDHIEVIRRRLAMAPGGRFGLFCHAPEGTRFDDVHARTHTEVPLDRPADLALWRRAQHHTLEYRDGPLPGLGASGIPFSEQAHLAKTSVSNEAGIVFGALTDPPRRIDLALAPEGHHWSVELIAGWQGADVPHYRLAVTRAGVTATAELLRVEPGVTNRLLDRAQLNAPDGKCVTLTLDATAEGELHGRINDATVVWSPLCGAAVGAGGFNLGRETRACVALPVSRGEIELLTDRFEKNNIYVTDPFMRHWAAPEGQWLEYPDGRAWYKSDVLRRAELRVPSVNNSVLHLLIPEGQTNGLLQVAVTNNHVLLTSRLDGTNAPQTLARIATSHFPESQPVADGPRLRFYTTRLDDHIFTLHCDTGLVARCRLPVPFPGRRMMFQGMNTAQLGFTRVIREPVLDCLFTESLHDWVINGGTWEVINRFQCYPDWSHMNGESADSLAALWSKYEFAGDFSVEFFAGMRHGWYNRLGDLNLTVLNTIESTASGYTLVTAGWDPDESQLWSRIFRDGQLLDKSDRYTVPRPREGNKRKGYEPLVAPGRDVHGAWYSLRLRRIGGRLTFDFDNERIIDVEDPEPLDAGSLGIWTYRNSMMVARVRITADAIRPRPFRRTRLRALPAPPAPPPARAAAPAITANGWPLQPLQEPFWQADESGSHSRLAFHHPPSGAPEMHFHAAQGGGAFMAHAHLPTIPAEELLGWRFEVARHPEARFNFEYTLGTPGEKGFTPATEHSFVICGSDETRGPRLISGRLPRQPAPTPEEADPAWTPVHVWLPIQGVANKQHVRLDGFGNLQPSDIQQGLLGNPPGAWYAVRNFRPIYRGTPRVAGAAPELLEALHRELENAPAGRLTTQRLAAEIDPARSVLEWGVIPGGDMGLVARPARTPPQSLRVVSTLPWPNALLTDRNVRLNDTPVPLVWIENNELIIPLPRDPAEVSNASFRLTLDLLDGRTFTQIFADGLPPQSASDHKPEPPLLIAFDIKDHPACLQNFESRTVQPSGFQAAQLPTLRFDDPRQGTYLRFANNGKPARLQGLLAQSYDLARWPLLQLRYRGDPMARVSFRASNAGMIAFSEAHSPAAEVPLATGTRLDHAWHTWMGRISGVTLSRPVTAGYALTASELRVGSCANHDQTGRYSTLDIDALTAGPVFGPREALVFRAHYFATDPQINCEYTLAEGAAFWESRPRAQRTAAIWTPCSNNVWTTANLDALPDGIHRLILRATGPENRTSRETDIPFMIDRQPLVVTSEVVATDKHNGTLLNFHFISGAGAPPRMAKLQLTCNDKPFAFANDASSLVHFKPNGISLELNWPLILRKQLNTASDGAKFHFHCESLPDAAGNASLPHNTTVTVDFAADKRPPAFVPLATPTNAIWWAPAITDPSHLFTVNRTLTAQPGVADDKSGFVALKAGPKDGMASRVFSNPNWNSSTHRYLALSLRLAPKSSPPTNSLLFELCFRPSKLPDGVKSPARGLYRLPVYPHTRADNKIVFGNLDWKAGRWNDLIVDTAACLQNFSGNPNPFLLQEFAFAMPSNAPAVVQIRAGAIMTPWAPTDLINLRAYDASGISGLHWQGNGYAPHSAFRPALVALPEAEPCWMRLTIRDRAGNSTPVILLPIPPRLPITTKLPLSEEW